MALSYDGLSYDGLSYDGIVNMANLYKGETLVFQQSVAILSVNFCTLSRAEMYLA